MPLPRSTSPVDPGKPGKPSAPRKRKPTQPKPNTKPPSALALILSQTLPMPVQEHWFALPERNHRFDYAWPDYRIALEIDGGVHSGGRHTRGAGYMKDLEKFSIAAKRGWYVVRVATQHVNDGSVIGLMEAVFQNLWPNRKTWKPWTVADEMRDIARTRMDEVKKVVWETRTEVAAVVSPGGHVLSWAERRLCLDVKKAVQDGSSAYLIRSCIGESLTGSRYGLVGGCSLFTTRLLDIGDAMLLGDSGLESVRNVGRITPLQASQQTDLLRGFRISFAWDTPEGILGEVEVRARSASNS